MQTATATATPSAASESVVVTKAVRRAADRLGLSNKILARIIGVSEASVSRMDSGSYLLMPAEKPFEVALLFLRLFRALDAIVAGDEEAARTWLRSEHATLGGVPAVLIQSLSGLVDVVGYVDARRALI
jgi:ribosome-binding protein aMBF1 (putative translation factor)